MNISLLRRHWRQNLVQVQERSGKLRQHAPSVEPVPALHQYWVCQHQPTGPSPEQQSTRRRLQFAALFPDPEALRCGGLQRQPRRYAAFYINAEMYTDAPSNGLGFHHHVARQRASTRIGGNHIEGRAGEGGNGIEAQITP
jgi:hypothetical protein